MGEKVCNVCGTVLSENDSFCPNCGCEVETPAMPNVEPMGAGNPISEGFSEQQQTTVLTGNPFGNIQDNTFQNNTYQDNSFQNNAYQDNTYQDNSFQNNAYQNMNPGMATEAPRKKETKAAGKGKEGKSENGLGIAAMIIGILSVLCCAGGSLFGIIGIILSIICMAKKKGKPFCIVGLITSILGFALGVVILILSATSWDEISSNLGLSNNHNPGNIDYVEYTADDSGNNVVTTADTEGQVYVNGNLYMLPGTLSSMNLSVGAADAETVQEIQGYGIEPGSYEFVILESPNGYAMWGYLENTSNATVYSVDELSVTGLNVDNYSGECTAYSMIAFGGVSIGMSKQDVESVVGTCEKVDSDGYEVYHSVSGKYALRIKYDMNSCVEELDVTSY